MFGLVWQSLRTSSTAYRTQFDLSKDIKVRLHTLLKGPCANNMKVKSTNFAELIQKPPTTGRSSGTYGSVDLNWCGEFTALLDLFYPPPHIQESAGPKSRILPVFSITWSTWSAGGEEARRRRPTHSIICIFGTSRSQRRQLLSRVSGVILSKMISNRYGGYNQIHAENLRWCFTDGTVTRWH